jgi:alpha-galactosidase
MAPVKKQKHHKSGYKPVKKDKHHKAHKHESWTFGDAFSYLLYSVCLVLLIGLFVNALFFSSDNEDTHDHHSYLDSIANRTSDVTATSYSYRLVNGRAITPAAYSRTVPLTSAGSYSQNKPLLAPTMGFNTWDALHFDCNETQVYQLAASMIGLGLVQSGYRTLVIDDHWFVAPSFGDSFDATSVVTVIGPHGTQQPDPAKFPNGLRPVADWLHRRGMQVGVHMMAGIPRQAVTNPVMFPGSTQSTSQIIQGDAARCTWSTPVYNFLDPNNPNAQIWLNLMFEELASWGVDYVKIDCFYGWNWDAIADVGAMVEMYRLAASLASREIFVSISPGSSYQYNSPDSTLNQFKSVSHRVHSARAIVDFWPQGVIQGQPGNTYPLFSQTQDLNAWSMHWVLGRYLPLLSNFGGSNVAGAIPSQLFFVDLDMLPFGGPINLNNHFYEGNVPTILSYDQQRFVMTIWCMLRSPLFIGGDIRTPDMTSLTILQHPELIAINTYSGNATVLSQDSSVPATIVYFAERQELGLYWIVATNMGGSSISKTLTTSSIGKSLCDITNVWTTTSLGTQTNSVTVIIPSISFVLLRFSNCL